MSAAEGMFLPQGLYRAAASVDLFWGQKIHRILGPIGARNFSITIG
jgi:hypothetical protein